MSGQESLLTDLKVCSRRKGVSLEDAFGDYDPKKTGTVTMAQLRKVLSYLNFWVNEAKFNSIVTDYGENGLFHYKNFISGQAAPVPESLPERILVRLALELKTAGFTIREWFQQFDPNRTGRIARPTFIRSWRLSAEFATQIAESYKFPTTDEIDYFRLADETDAALAGYQQPSIQIANLPPFFSRVREAMQIAQVDPIDSFVLADKYKRNRITGQQFSYELGMFGVTLSPVEWRDLVSLFSDIEGVDYRRFCDVLKSEIAANPPADAPTNGVDLDALLKHLSVTCANRHTQIEELFTDCDARGTGTIPTLRFFRNLAVARFALSPREVSALESAFKVDGQTMDYRRFLAAISPKAAQLVDLRPRLGEFLRLRSISLQPILARFDRARTGRVTTSDLFTALRSISFDLNAAEVAQIKQSYGVSPTPTVPIDAFCAGIDFVAPAVAPDPRPPAGFVKPTMAAKAPRPAPPAAVVAVLDAAALAVDRLKIDLFDAFRAMDQPTQRLVPMLKFRNYLVNIGVRDCEPAVDYYAFRDGIRYLDFVDDLRAFGRLVKTQREPSPETQRVLAAIKARAAADGIGVRGLFTRFDRDRSHRVLKLRLRDILVALEVDATAADLEHFADDFEDPKWADYVIYGPIVDYLEALPAPEEEPARTQSMRGASATDDREIYSMLNTFRGKLVARHKAAADVFRGCNPEGVSQQEFRERLSNLAIVLREMEIQRLIRKYRRPMAAEIDWVAFCRDIETSKTLQAEI
jgi:Ca2+-binding EF-hand superfamily protein